MSLKTLSLKMLSECSRCADVRQSVIVVYSFSMVSFSDSEHDVCQCITVALAKFVAQFPAIEMLLLVTPRMFFQFVGNCECCGREMCVFQAYLQLTL